MCASNLRMGNEQPCRSGVGVLFSVSAASPSALRAAPRDSVDQPVLHHAERDILNAIAIYPEKSIYSIIVTVRRQVQMLPGKDSRFRCSAVFSIPPESMLCLPYCLPMFVSRMHPVHRPQYSHT